MRRWLIIGLIAVVAVVAGYFGAAKIWGLPTIISAPRYTETSYDKTMMHNLGQFITNLVDQGRYIRLSIDLELVDGKKGEEVAARASEIKTDIYALLRAKTYADLAGEQGLRQPQEEVKSG